MRAEIQKKINKHDLNGVLEFLTLARPRIKGDVLSHAHDLLRELSFFTPCYLRKLACSVALLGLRGNRADLCKNGDEDMFLSFIIRGFEILQEEKMPR